MVSTSLQLLVCDQRTSRSQLPPGHPSISLSPPNQLLYRTTPPILPKKKGPAPPIMLLLLAAHETNPPQDTDARMMSKTTDIALLSGPPPSTPGTPLQPDPDFPVLITARLANGIKSTKRRERKRNWSESTDRCGMGMGYESIPTEKQRSENGYWRTRNSER
jgi:hypothetical protein